MLVGQTEDFRADTRNSPETSMALRSQQPGNRSRLGVPGLLGGARAEPRNRCSDRPARAIELNLSVSLGDG
jgi:hypothetical protein